MGLDWKRRRWGMEGRGETIYAFRAYRRRLRSRHEMTTTTTTRCPRPSIYAAPRHGPHPICAHGADQEVAPSAATTQSPRRRRVRHGAWEHTTRSPRSWPRLQRWAATSHPDWDGRVHNAILSNGSRAATARVKRQLFHNAVMDALVVDGGLP